MGELEPEIGGWGNLPLSLTLDLGIEATAWQIFWLFEMLEINCCTKPIHDCCCYYFTTFAGFVLFVASIFRVTLQ